MAIDLTIDGNDLAALPRAAAHDVANAPSPLQIPVRITAPPEVAIRLDSLIGVKASIAPGPAEEGGFLAVDALFTADDGREKPLVHHIEPVPLPDFAGPSARQIAFQVALLGWLDHDWRQGKIGLALGTNSLRITRQMLSLTLVATPFRVS